MSSNNQTEIIYPPHPQTGVMFRPKNNNELYIYLNDKWYNVNDLVCFLEEFIKWKEGLS